MSIDVTAAALFSSERPPIYRHWLRRDFGGSLWALGSLPTRIWTFIAYNPSVADADVNDPSVRRMIGYAKAGGATSLVVTNIMTAIGTDPDVLATLEDPVGPMADEAILTAAALATASGGRVIAAWGVPKGKASTRLIAQRRAAVVRGMVGVAYKLHAMRITARGYPEHPLYLPKKLEPTPWT